MVDPQGKNVAYIHLLNVGKQFTTLIKRSGGERSRRG
jgi:hypothetical protein